VSLRKGRFHPFVRRLVLNHDRGCRSRRAMIVDLALSVTGSQLIASVLPTVCPPLQGFGPIANVVFVGGQRPARALVRLYSGPYRHATWLQDRVEGYLAFVRIPEFFTLLFFLIDWVVDSDRMVCTIPNCYFGDDWLS